MASESDFIRHPDDFVALSGEQESGWLDGIVEDTLTWILPDKLMGVSISLSLSLSHITVHDRLSPLPVANILAMGIFNLTILHLDDLHVLAPTANDGSFQFTLIQQAPDRCRGSPCPGPDHGGFAGGTVGRVVLCRGPECVEDLSDYDLYAVFRGSVECVYEGEEA